LGFFVPAEVGENSNKRYELEQIVTLRRQIELEIAHKAYFPSGKPLPTEKTKLLTTVLSPCGLDAQSIHPTVPLGIRSSSSEQTNLES
jgi:hypothetical protein